MRRDLSFVTLYKVVDSRIQLLTLPLKATPARPLRPRYQTPFFWEAFCSACLQGPCMNCAALPSVLPQSEAVSWLSGDPWDWLPQTLTRWTNHRLIAAERPHSHRLPQGAAHPRDPAPLLALSTDTPPPQPFSLEALSCGSGPVSIWMLLPTTGQALPQGETQEGRSDMYFLLIRN